MQQPLAQAAYSPRDTQATARMRLQAVNGEVPSSLQFSNRNQNQFNAAHHGSGSPSVRDAKGQQMYPRPANALEADRMHSKTQLQQLSSQAVRQLMPKNQALHSSSKDKYGFPGQQANQATGASALLAANRSPQPGKRKNAVVSQGRNSPGKRPTGTAQPSTSLQRHLQ